MRKCCHQSHWWQLMTLVKSVLRWKAHHAPPHLQSFPVVSSEVNEWTSADLLVTLQTVWTQGGYEVVHFFHNVLCVLCVFRWSTPHLEARLKGCTSTIWSWAWCFWPEDAMRRRQSVRCFSWVNSESVLMLFCWFHVLLNVKSVTVYRCFFKMSWKKESDLNQINHSVSEKHIRP